VSPRDKLSAQNRVLMVLSNKYCLSLEELERYTGVKRNVLLVVLHRLAKKGIITRTWGKFGGKRYRKYCLKTAIKEELGVE